ncbi:protein SERAC1 [Marchantia polymorpha subsp. ruderalis]|uniref:NB-ARC domain-containing protein n=2 Tax=Marchantia polymorpha TaxID=3197 RepID=A0AAF6ANQ5_MARPO|nr:hypothetical protein MARPO_0014s0162 [Marchantia polymorpha]BBM98075.1 hypothetical protein Mp_1g10650 [Marchantia polymorpha subsp. ruderalis]|eukprot:PTQ45650.1 hypothetical protein MARPO_0014s0162 [Marchantia polymorpha]
MALSPSFEIVESRLEEPLLHSQPLSQSIRNVTFQPQKDSVFHAAPPKVNQLTDNIYELYTPGATSRLRLDVVFFHGLQLDNTCDAHLSTWTSSDAHLSTWTSRGSKEVWPMIWLPEEFPEARILCVKYDARTTRSAEYGRLDLHNAAENLTVSLIHANVGQHPIILVGHCYGGLLIKQLCLQAHMSETLRGRNPEFLKRVKGVFFYGTPHRGSSFFENVPFSENVGVLRDASPLLDFVKVLCADSARLHENFDSLRSTHKWRIAGVGELLESDILKDGEKVMIVHEASARYGTEFTMEREDHFSLCMPWSRSSNTYIRLTEFIQRIREDIYSYKGMRNRSDLQMVPKMAIILLRKSLLFETVRNFLGANPLVGLHGMGGVGKTTLAKMLFNDLCAEFECTCFIPGFRLRGDYKEMEDILYSSMYHHGQKIEQGKLIRDRIDPTQTRLLLVLDDIDDVHVEFLWEISSKFDCVNSRFIFTSQNKEILDRCIVNSRDQGGEACVFDVDCLSHEKSKELFMSHAFPFPTEPSPSVTEWIDKIVAKCEGLPLTLEVMGSYLKKEYNEYTWIDCLLALDKAENIANFRERLWLKLQISYDRLNPMEQEMFLDAATLFCNSTWNLQEAKTCWSVLYGFEHIRWKTLVDLSLVYAVREEDCIQMHEQMRSLGMKLGGNRIRSILTKEKSSSSSITPMNTEEVIALRLGGCMPLDASHIFQMKKLRYLDVEEELMCGEDDVIFPSSVILLRARGEVNILRLRGEVNIHDDLVPDCSFLCSLLCSLHFTDGNVHLPGCLVALDLKAPLTYLPRTVTENRDLQVLKFEDCLFERLPQTFVEFRRLRHLTFSSCKELRSLPEDFGRFSELHSLELHHCYKFEALPDSFGNLHSLKNLMMVSLHNLQKLPENFGALSKLESLKISDAHNIYSLPDSFGRLTQLRDLYLDNMSNLLALPSSFGKLSQMRRLSMVGCMMTKELPRCFGNLLNLTILDIRDCRSVKVYPGSIHVIRRLPKLRYLIVETNFPRSKSEETSYLSERQFRELWLSG